MNPRTAKRRKQQRGFTLIEVMVSLGVMTVGAMAILALQQHTIRSNSHARQLTVAMQIAQRWVERFKQDAHTWNLIGVWPGGPLAAAVLSQTTFLREIATAPNVFQTIPRVTATVSNAFDYQGNDVSNVSADPPVYYCASFRPAWVYYGRAMRVDVRVWFAREGSLISANFPACVDDNAMLNPPTGSQLNNYHVVYLPTVIRMVPVYN